LLGVGQYKHYEQTSVTEAAYLFQRHWSIKTDTSQVLGEGLIDGTRCAGILPVLLNIKGTSTKHLPF